MSSLGVTCMPIIKPREKQSFNAIFSYFDKELSANAGETVR
jgi:hypothetical protein